ncbi:MFS transporter, partial [Streptomyces sp. MBT65]|uniref:MFS transporter n=1 Tax=Streptomyces sp. MBT65 TaxID=1488395 RepID=UPI00190E29C2
APTRNIRRRPWMSPSRRRMFLVGAAGFTLGSLLCAISVSPQMLIGARIVQGLFGAVMLPQGLGMIKEMFPPKESQKAFGMFGPVMGLSAVCGPILAGWLVDADYFGTGWRMIFLINLPLGAAAILGALRYLPRGRSEAKPRLDIPGMLLVSLAALLLIFPLVQGREYDWPVWTFVMMAASIAVFAVFARYESYRSRNGLDPLVVPSLFRKRGFSGGMVLGLVFFSTMQGFMLVFNLYTQIGLGYSPLKAGLVMVPWSGGMIVGFGVAQGFVRFGRTVLQAGTVVMALGVFGVWLTLDQVGSGVGPWQLLPSLLVTGIGMGLLMAPFFDIVLASVEQHETGSAAGTMTAMQQLGGAFGVAILGTVFFGLLGGGIAGAVDHRSDDLRGQLSAAHVAPAVQDRVVADLRRCASDRATAKDPAANPASCALLEKDTRSAVTTSEAGARIPAALEATASSAFRSGFGSVMQTLLWIVDGMLALTFLLSFLLPRHARPEEAAGH